MIPRVGDKEVNECTKGPGHIIAGWRQAVDHFLLKGLHGG